MDFRCGNAASIQHSHNRRHLDMSQTPRLSSPSSSSSFQRRTTFTYRDLAVTSLSYSTYPGWLQYQSVRLSYGHCLTLTTLPIVLDCRMWRADRWPRRTLCRERTERADSGSLRKRREQQQQQHLGNTTDGGYTTTTGAGPPTYLATYARISRKLERDRNERRSRS